MSSYLNPPEQALEGENLSGRGYAGDYSKYTRMLGNRKLVGYADRGWCKQSRIIESEDDFNDLYSQYRQGILLSLTFYAV